MKNRSAVSRLLCFFYWVLFCWEMLVSVVHGGLNIEMVRNLSYYEFYVFFQQQKSISPKRSAKRVFDCSCRKWRFDLNTDKGNLLFYGRHLLHAKKAFPKTMFDAVLLKDMTAEKNWGIFWFLPFFPVNINSTIAFFLWVPPHGCQVASGWKILNWKLKHGIQTSFLKLPLLSMHHSSTRWTEIGSSFLMWAWRRCGVAFYTKNFRCSKNFVDISFPCVICYSRFLPTFLYPIWNCHNTHLIVKHCYPVAFHTIGLWYD